MVKKRVKKISKFKISKKDIDFARKKTEIALKSARIKLLKAEKDVRKYVNKNPRKAAAIAAGIGVAVGAAIASAMRKKK